MTSPDMNTLNGALEQLGITMAENLVTMGVTDADPSDGLTTLAGKILSISPTPTPTVDSLTLVKSAGKQILSYADSGASPETEYCTVTATALDSNNQGVSGQSVVFKVGTTTVATETTDSNGEASYTYTSQGSGDVVLSAECSSLIQTYSIEDYRKYIGTSTSASITGMSKFTNVVDFGVYDTSDMYYSAILSASRFNGRVNGICLANSVSTSELSPYPSGYCDYRLMGDPSSKGLGGGCQSGGDYAMHNTSGALSPNTEYLFEMELHSNSMTGKITKVSDNTVVYNQTITPPKDFSNWHFALFLFNSGSDGTNVTYKEVKIKPL